MSRPSQQPRVRLGSRVRSVREIGSGVRREAFSAIGRAARAAVGMVSWVEVWLTSSKKALYGSALLRMLAGASALGLLLSNFSTRFYTFGGGSAWNYAHWSPDVAFPGMPVFSLVRDLAYDPVGLTVVYVAAMVLSVLVIVGYRTRLILPVFFVLWVGLISLSAMFGDQSDNMSRIVIFFLFFLDSSARWSLDARRRRRWSGTGRNVLVRLWRGQAVWPSWFTTVAHNLVVVLLVYQVVVAYMAGGLFKADGETWQNGTAIWGPLHMIVFSPFPGLNELIASSAVIVAVASIGTVLIQVSFPFMLLNRWTRIIALFVIFGFHVAIGVLMGLPWFSLWMLSVDALLIRDRTYERLSGWMRRVLLRDSDSRPDASAATTKTAEPDSHDEDDDERGWMSPSPADGVTIGVTR